ncbi:MAG: sugar ABC transporter ATP-binding protein [Lachnospiraceae bacterium]|nr:sugar ABC transporter ATP-binding protein [Lachnospiraceae bacterium]
MARTILEIKHVSKSFPGVKALDDVSFCIKEGHVHAIVGENGAGKSTLIKILAGIYTRYEGEIQILGEKEVFESPQMAKLKGISVVHQELKLSEPLSIAENIFLGKPLRTKLGFVDWKAMNRRAQEMVDELNVKLDVTLPVETLTVAQKQIVEICKSIVAECKILIMDEPSATLTNKELDVLFGIIAKLKADGVTIIYISHRMEEVFNLSDELSVLRDGKHIGTLRTEEIDKDALVNMMVGRTVNVEYPRSEVAPGEVILKVDNLTRKGVFENISFELRKGEILGIAGLVGAGRTELMRGILGIDPVDGGEIYLRGEKVKYKNFREAIRDGFGLVPEDRKLQGSTQIFPIKSNICMTDFGKISKQGIVNDRLEIQYAQEYVKTLRVATPSIDTEVQYLSGGNQQKVVIAKWLYKNSEILIMDEPTRGIDVGAKREIYDLICELVKQGKTIIVISSELPEVLGISDRILVLHEGRMAGELSAEEATQEKVMNLCT